MCHFYVVGSAVVASPGFALKPGSHFAIRTSSSTISLNNKGKEKRIPGGRREGTSSRQRSFVFSFVIFKIFLCLFSFRKCEPGLMLFGDCFFPYSFLIVKLDFQLFISRNSGYGEINCVVAAQVAVRPGFETFIGIVFKQKRKSS